MNSAMKFTDTSRGKNYAKDPAVIEFGNRYLMYYSIPPFEDGRTPQIWSIGIAESTNLDHWTKVCELTCFTELEKNGFCAPGAIVIGLKVHLFYQTYGNGANDAICHAVSEDGVNFIPDETNPVFRATGSWNNGRAIDADVIAYGDRLLLYAATRNPSGEKQMLVAASAPLDSGFHRKDWCQLGNDSILKPELPWEQLCIEAPAVCCHNGKLFMFYGGAYNNAPQQIGCAVSENGIDWQRISELPVLPNGDPGNWNSSESGHPFVFTASDGTKHLFFQGNNDNGKSWYLSRKLIHWNNGYPVIP